METTGVFFLDNVLPKPYYPRLQLSYNLLLLTELRNRDPPDRYRADLDGEKGACMRNILSLASLFLALCATSAFSQSVAENIRPVGQLCVEGQPCVGSQAGATTELLLEETVNSGAESDSAAVSGGDSSEDSAAPTPPVASGEIYEIEMRNQGTDGVMVFEPSVVSLQVGDSVTFKATDAGHNSASIEGMIPAGAAIWDSGMSQDITVTFTEEGTYVYQCTPHLMMAMVGVITVGDSNKNLEEIVAAAAEKKSEFVMEQGRLDSFLQRLQ